MAEQSIYTVGGTVQAGDGLYIPRKADDELLVLCRTGSFAYILTSRQMGKSSLMVRTAERLSGEGIRSAMIDLTQLGVQVTAEQWYLGLLAAIEDQLMIETDVVQGWQARAHLTVTQRLTHFFQRILPAEVAAPVVIFIDEIDSTLSLSFTDDFFAAIRYLYNARAHTPELRRLSFVLIGVATPGDLIKDPQRTPFNIGQRVDLTDWTFEEALPLADGLGLPPEEAEQVLRWVLKWTGGHPYLTQRLCRAVKEENRRHLSDKTEHAAIHRLWRAVTRRRHGYWSEDDVGQVVASTFLGEKSQEDSNLQFVRDMLTKRGPSPTSVLTAYSEIRRGKPPVADEEQSLVKSHLKLSGAVRREQGTLRVRNLVYWEVFDDRWVQEQSSIKPIFHQGVYVSYARKDRDQVLPWVQQLQSAGVSVWIDVTGHDGAQLWMQAIVEAIEGCTVLLLMLSSSSEASPQVLREVALASERGKPILSLLLEPIAIPAAMRYFLAGIQQIALFGDGSEKTFQVILRSLTSLGVLADADQLAPALASPAHSLPLHNLPILPDRFIGREREMAQIKRLLATNTLLTLTGAGGCGKTRLALETIATLLETYVDGVWLVALAGLSDPRLVPQAVANILGVREEPDRPLSETLVDFLRPKSLLLLLDDCEHLLSACAQLAVSLLRCCPSLRILTTSREALGISGEVVWRVPSLSLPDLRSLPALGPDLVPTVEQYEAVQLFIQRARVSQPEFAVTSRNAAAVAEICHRLDGIPLAIELAAARVKMLTAEQIAARLDDRFRLLVGGSRMLAPRQQSLRAVIDWSYDLLSEAERALLRRLSSFVGGFTLAAAEAICDREGIEQDEVIDLLAHLVDKSLVIAEEQSEEPRYQLQETIRLYGGEKLREAGENHVLGKRHRDWFLELAEQAEPHLSGPQSTTWLERLERENQNLRVALQWSVENGEPEAALRLSGALWRFWLARGHLREELHWLETALSMPTDPDRSLTRAKALNAAGALAHDQDDLAKARAMYEESLSIGRERDDSKSVASALLSLGNVAMDQGREEAATRLYEQAVALSREIGDKGVLAKLLNNLGSAAARRGNYEEAVARFEESLALKREFRDQRGIANSLNNLGDLLISHGDYERAAGFLDESLRLLGELGDSFGIAIALSNLANLTLEQGDPVRAVALYRESLSINQTVEAPQVIVESLAGIASVVAAQGDPLAAARLYGAAEALLEANRGKLHSQVYADLEGRLIPARASLDDEAFAAASAEGRAMTQEQAVAYALASADASSGERQ